MDPAILTATTARVATLSPSILPYNFTTTQPFLWLFSYNSYITFIYYYMFLCDVVMCGCRLPEVVLPWRWQGRLKGQGLLWCEVVVFYRARRRRSGVRTRIPLSHHPQYAPTTRHCHTIYLGIRQHNMININI